MEDRTVRFEVEAFDVEYAAVARLHDHRDLSIARRLAHEELHVERIALFDDEVESVEELAEVLRANAGRFDDDAQVRIDLGDAPRGDHRLVDAEVQHTRGDAVQVRQFQGVEVGQADLAGQALHRDARGRCVCPALSPTTPTRSVR